ncbi:MAG: hypothetical protein JWQ25_2123 [Daejeonella sp.]|nr:hypothetical protein [Daejeonella sp.]
MSKKDKSISNAEKSAKKASQEQERLEILAKADEVKGEQLTISITGEVQKENELRQFALGSIEDPEKHYELYYKGINKLLYSNLPKGLGNKPARDYIYEERNTFLTGGKRIKKNGTRGGDGRMGYIADAEELFQVIMDWIIKNGSMVDLFNTLRSLNVSKGYGTRKF